MAGGDDSLHGLRIKVGPMSTRRMYLWLISRLTFPLFGARPLRFLTFKASFYQVPLPIDARASFPFRGPDDRLYELLRLPMGYKASPELMQLLTSSLAGVRGVVTDEYAAPSTLGVDIWIENIRIHGPEHDVSRWSQQILQTAEETKVTLGEMELHTVSYQFIGVFL